MARASARFRAWKAMAGRFPWVETGICMVAE